MLGAMRTNRFRTRSRLGALVLVCLPTLYCSEGTPTEAPATPAGAELASQPPSPQCAEIPGFMDQLNAIGDRVDAVWTPPSDTSLARGGEFMVFIRFSINQDGTLRDVTAPGDEPEAVKASVLEAIRQAQPAAPLPPELACMSTLDDLSITFMRSADPSKQ